MALARSWYLSATALLMAGAASAQEACNSYTIVAGDNLRYIARAAYGDADMYRVIFNANIDVIGETADLIEVGATLSIPCDPRTETAATDETKATTVASAAASQPAPATESTPATESAPATEVAPIRIVTGNGYAPFADEMLPGGGMFTQLVEMAIFRADPKITYNLSFVTDWQAHIDALLPSGAYDLSFPWVRPDCESPEMMSPGDQSRCENFVFSAPLYEVVEGFFALNDSGLGAAVKYSDLAGKRICRPEAYTTGVLDSAGLGTNNITLIRAISVYDCFEYLRDGKTDLVSIDAEVGDAAAASLGMTKDVVQNPYLTTLTSLHVIAHKSNARAVEMIVKLDSGVIEMYETGEWYDIVSTALAQNMPKP